MTTRNTKTKLLIGASLLTAVLAGCAKTEATKDGNLISNGAGEATVTDHTLSDGTKCAVLIGYYKGAISCGWK